jgi:two-component system NtrC family sensor kinase
VTRTLLSVPLEDEGDVIGILVLQNKKSGDFTLYDQQLLSTIAKTIVNSFISMQKIQKFHVLNAHLEASRWELIRSRNTLRSLFDNLPDSLYIIDRSYHLNAVNSTRAERAKGEPSLLVNKHCYETFFELEKPCEGCLVSETFTKKRVTFRSIHHWEEGQEPMDWEISSYPITDDGDEVIQAIMVEKDVTERKRLEGFLAQSEKMAAVGTLAAGIAHEINNPLAVVMANAQIMQREVPPENVDWVDSLDLIYKAGSRAFNSVRNLLNFARKEEFEINPTDINESIESVLEMLKHELISRSIELDLDLADNLPLVKASSNHLQGVWLNLFINAMDAIDAINVLDAVDVMDTVDAVDATDAVDVMDTVDVLDANDERPQGHIRVATLLHENEVRISITDNGEGIPEEKIKRIFEPFFTTKDPNKGTGLGLSVCHRVIKQHGGLILVDSQVGVGTTFTVVLSVSING